MIAHSYGPIKGRIHDSAMLALSCLYYFSYGQNGNVLWAYGDPANFLKKDLAGFSMEKTWQHRNASMPVMQICTG